MGSQVDDSPAKGRYDFALDDVKLGAKALQNMQSSASYFDRMLTFQSAAEAQILSALFTAGVIRYARPFSQSSDGKGHRAYPLKALKKADGFDLKVHQHLVGIRNTLVAHDNLEAIEPKVLTGYLRLFIQTTLATFDVPVSIGVSNKCVAFPLDRAAVTTMRDHAVACTNAIHAKVQVDIERLRDEGILDPAAADARVKYNAPVEPSEPGPQVLPNFAGDPWFTPEHPDFSEVHNGFYYDVFQVQRVFNERRRVQLPDGNWANVEGHPNPAATQPPKAPDTE